MTNTFKNYPFYIRLASILLCICLIIGLLYVGQHIIFPVLLALLFAILLRPVVNFFIKKLRFPKVLAISFSVLLALFFLTSVVLFVSWQIGDIANDWNKIKLNVNTHFHNIQHWIKQQFQISYSEQDKYLKQVTKKSMDNGGPSVGGTLSSFTDALMNVILIPIYTFLFLIYHDLFVDFLFKLFSKEHHKKLTDILVNVKQAIHSYLTGLLTEMGIVATLTTLGYMIVGVQYALLLGVITGILNLIPYVGITLAGLLSILATLSGSTDLSIIAGVLVVNVIVQFFDNNILVPLVVSSKVKINAFVSLVSIITGGAIGGVAGMFLAIPLIAVIKVVFDRIDFLEPWGFVMGDNLPKNNKVVKIKIPFWGKKTK
jgi:predicted PurR-regulated permease PerM